MSRAVAKISPPRVLTLEQWAELDDDVEGELVDGVLEEEEMPTFLHEVVVAFLLEVLRPWARRRAGQVVGSETKIAVAARRGRKPDVSVYLADKLPALEDRLIRVMPHLVVEVASPRPRDTRRDRIDKVHDYGRAGIRYYWILDPQLRSLEVFELGDSGRYVLALSRGGGRVRVPGCPGLILDLDALWNEIDEAARASAARRKGRSRIARKPR